jgi:hypothetical protein
VASAPMNTANTLKTLKAHLRSWATRSGATLDNDGYCSCADENLFGGLSAGARNDFERGDGSELGKAGARGKLQAVHSSSALACNWFDYWRNRDRAPLSRAFGVPRAFSELVGLEQKFSTRLGGIGPNLDVVLKCIDGTLFAIECKFMEPYAPSKGKTFLKAKYFHDGHHLWSDAGLPGCQAVAEALQAGTHQFKVLDVAQLLKHMLALALNAQRWSLCCVWFEVPGAIAARHRDELNDFVLQIGGDAAHFSALTYQELFARMAPFLGQEHAEYGAYLRDRYLFLC